MKKILVIEDNEDMCENIAEIFLFAGYQVDTAYRGDEGWAKIIQLEPDLIICDLHLPVLGGFEILKKVRFSENTSKTPFICLTAKASEENRERSQSLGTSAFISKPFQNEELEKTVLQLLFQNPPRLAS